MPPELTRAENLDPQLAARLDAKLAGMKGRDDVRVLAVTGIRPHYEPRHSGVRMAVEIDFTYTTGRPQRRRTTVSYATHVDDGETVPAALWGLVDRAVAAAGTQHDTSAADLTVTVTRSSGSDAAVLVMIDTGFEPDGSDGGPGLRVHVNDATVLDASGTDGGATGGVDFSPSEQARRAGEAALTAQLAELAYVEADPL